MGDKAAPDMLATTDDLIISDDSGHEAGFMGSTAADVPLATVDDAHMPCDDDERPAKKRACTIITPLTSADGTQLGGTGGSDSSGDTRSGSRSAAADDSSSGTGTARQVARAVRRVTWSDSAPSQFKYAGQPAVRTLDDLLALQHRIEECLSERMHPEDLVQHLGACGFPPLATRLVLDQLRAENKDYFKAFDESVLEASGTYDDPFVSSS